MSGFVILQEVGSIGILQFSLFFHTKEPLYDLHLETLPERDGWHLLKSMYLLVEFISTKKRFK